MIKSIDKKIIIYSIFTICSIFGSIYLSKIIRLDISILLFVFLIFHLTFFIFLVNKNTSHLILKTLLITVIAYGLFFLSFRSLREFFPIPSNEISDSVGFINYFRYPALFDLFFFIFLISIPIISFITLKYYEEKT